jgi:hypothetical protein
MTEQQTAEVFVREARPALYKTFLGSNTPRPQTINLQDWLAVLMETSYTLSCVHSQDVEPSIIASVPKGDVKLNLTTGQPATEADFKAFNEITAV